MMWVKNDVDYRKKDVSRLLGLVKLPLLMPSVRFCKLKTLVVTYIHFMALVTLEVLFLHELLQNDKYVVLGRPEVYSLTFIDLSSSILYSEFLVHYDFGANKHVAYAPPFPPRASLKRGIVIFPTPIYGSCLFPPAVNCL